MINNPYREESWFRTDSAGSIYQMMRVDDGLSLSWTSYKLFDFSKLPGDSVDMIYREQGSEDTVPGYVERIDTLSLYGKERICHFIKYYFFGKTIPATGASG